MTTQKNYMVIDNLEQKMNDKTVFKLKPEDSGKKISLIGLQRTDDLTKISYLAGNNYDGSNKDFKLLNAFTQDGDNFTFTIDPTVIHDIEKMGVLYVEFQEDYTCDSTHETCNSLIQRGEATEIVSGLLDKFSSHPNALAKIPYPEAKTYLSQSSKLDDQKTILEHKLIDFDKFKSMHQALEHEYKAMTLSQEAVKTELAEKQANIQKINTELTQERQKNSALSEEEQATNKALKDKERQLEEAFADFREFEERVSELSARYQNKGMMAKLSDYMKLVYHQVYVWRYGKHLADLASIKDKREQFILRHLGWEKTHVFRRSL